jgi:hypothetical protein
MRPADQCGDVVPFAEEWATCTERGAGRWSGCGTEIQACFTSVIAHRRLCRRGSKLKNEETQKEPDPETTNIRRVTWAGIGCLERIPWSVPAQMSDAATDALLAVTSSCRAPA